MTNNDKEARFLDLLYKSLVPKGHRPETDEEIERLIDLTEAAPYSNDKLERMLRKVRGEEPLYTSSEAPNMPQASSEVSEEFAALHRSQTKQISPETEEKIRKLKERIRKQEEEQNDSDEQ